VPTTAQGPWSDMLGGTHENTYIHDVMRQALNLDWRIWLPLIILD
jgi:alkaline phosphatase